MAEFKAGSRYNDITDPMSPLNLQNMCELDFSFITKGDFELRGREDQFNQPNS